MPSSSRYLISSQTLGSSAASVTFSSIPSTYTDLVVRYSVRCDVAGSVASIIFKINGSSSTSDYSFTILSGNGATASSSQVATGVLGYFQMTQGMPGATATSNTFASNELYVPNYAGSAKKTINHTTAQENNTTTAYIKSYAQLYNATTAITSLSFENADLFSAGSSFYLYGLKSS